MPVATSVRHTHLKEGSFSACAVSVDETTPVAQALSVAKVISAAQVKQTDAVGREPTLDRKKSDGIMISPLVI